MTRIILSLNREPPILAGMSRALAFILLALFLSLPRLSPAQDESVPDDAPPISITSPDTGNTFVYGIIKTHALVWNKSQKMLIARVTFAEEDATGGSAADDTHEFRLPGVTLDEAKGVFFATSEKGEAIPVARFKKVLFIQSIETTPNAVVRVLHPKGRLRVILEAISPNDPAMHPPADSSGATHDVDIHQILN